MGGVTDGMTEDTIKEYILSRHPEKYGKIISIKLVKKTEGDKEVNKGFGFIMTDSEDYADRISMGDRKCKIVEGTRYQEFNKAKSDDGSGGGGRGGGLSVMGNPRGGRGGFRGGAAAGGGYGGGRGGYGAGGYGAGGGGFGGGYGGYGGGYGGGY